MNCGNEIDYFPSNKKGNWCSNRCQADYKIKQRFVENSNWKYSMRNFIIRERGNCCESCGITEWNGNPISFHIDHINGNRKDNRKENLKVLCPNCHSQTETFASKNVSDVGRLKMRESALRTQKITKGL
jgi:Zn finger protein HypA/HybF involved in hydrogenase expression